MNRLFLDCNMGAAGDMIAGALIALIDDKEAFMERFNNAGIPGVTASLIPDKKCDISCWHFHVDVNGQVEESIDVTESEARKLAEHISKVHIASHHHTSMSDIIRIINSLVISASVKNHVINIYKLIAAAEGKAHGCEISDIHFHEVGRLDAIADILACAMAIEQLGVTYISSSTVNVGYGKVKCAHGILDVPAPATGFLLEGIPTTTGRFEGEMCTPTGAAVLKYFCKEFDDSPIVTVLKEGYGSGRKNFEEPNVVKAVLA